MGIAFTSDFFTGTTAVEAEPVFELPEFTASCEEVQAAIVSAFAARAELGRRLNQQIAHLRRREPRMADRKLSHMALVEMITALRDEFPPQEFNLYTDLGDGSAEIDTIAAADMVRNRRLLAELMEPPASRAERRAIREAKADASVTRAHGHIVEALLFGIE